MDRESLILESIKRFRIDLERFTNFVVREEDYSKIDDAAIVLYKILELMPQQAAPMANILIYAYYLGCNAGSLDDTVTAGTDILRRLEDAKTKGL
mgnify:CR=1 FL=1